MISHLTIIEQVLRLSDSYTTSTMACQHGVLISFICMPSSVCEYCSGLKQLKARDAQPVSVRGLP